jgi:hypothetical protein
MSSSDSLSAARPEGINAIQASRHRPDKPFRGEHLNRPPRATRLDPVETIRYVYTRGLWFAGRPPRTGALTSLEEERTELLDCVVQALKTPRGGPDRLEVCAALLRHLARTGRRL